ncbi:hypothetical protein ACET3X_007879 [Alternaria dauci]|uniref:Uncharacterized protein n=1 Tax=Alternaria dauci TaxID=48095 RepID=A0ABR3UEP9_9PLEO
MAKKEPSGNFGSRKDGNGGKPENEGGRAGKAPIEAKAKNERIPKLELVTRVRGQKADGAGKTQRHTWDVLRKNLESWQAAQKREKDIEKAHSRHYTIEADREAKVKAYKDALDEDKRGKKGPTKTAKKARNAVEKIYKKVQQDRKNKRFDREKGHAEHDAMTDAQESLEDWLYFHDSSKRRRRLRLLSPEGRKLAEQERFQRGTAYKLEASGKDSGHYDWVHSLLELYDSRDIGGQNYKQGLHDRLGNSVENSKNGSTSPVVGPDELHMWTPNYRRRLVGLRAPEEDDDSDTSKDIEPTHFRLNKAAIEARRAAVEKKSDMKTQNLEFDTHEARCRHQVKTYGNSRPDTSADRMTNTLNGVAAENRWGEIRTEQGLFISARESSWDWRTSYDCLGPVVSGWFPETSAIRD